MKRFNFIQHFNWRILLLRVLVNASALLITAVIVPRIYFVDRRFVILLWMALMLGVLNALVKPVVQFLTLPFIFATYGVVVVLINAGLLWFLSVLFPSLFAVNGFVWALLGGLVMGLISSFLESLLGVASPIVPEKYGSMRQQISSQPQALQSILAQAALSGEASGALAVSAKAAAAADVPDGAPPSPEPLAAGRDDRSEPVASGGTAPPAPAAPVAEGMASAGAGAGAPPSAPDADSAGSEG
jgi:putative membrane protein